MGVFGDELEIENAFASGLFRGRIECQDCLTQSHQRRLVAADLDLVVLRTYRRGLAGKHLDRTLRIGETFEAALAQRVENDNRHAALGTFLQVVQHARAVCPRIVAEEQNTIGRCEIVERDRADRHSDA